jgi:hypothetical protein
LDYGCEKQYCFFCKEEKKYINGELEGIWFENPRDLQPWKYLPKYCIAHADCYIENICLETIKKEKDGVAMLNRKVNPL